MKKIKITKPQLKIKKLTTEQRDNIIDITRIGLSMAITVAAGSTTSLGLMVLGNLGRDMAEANDTEFSVVEEGMIELGSWAIGMTVGAKVAQHMESVIQGQCEMIFDGYDGDGACLYANN